MKLSSKTLRIAFLFMAFSLPFAALAESDSICSDLGHFSCDNTAPEDGTGVVHPGNSLGSLACDAAKKMIPREIRSVTAGLIKQHETLKLGSPDAANFVAAAASVARDAGLVGDFACGFLSRFTADPKSPRCRGALGHIGYLCDLELQGAFLHGNWNECLPKLAEPIVYSELDFNLLSNAPQCFDPEAKNHPYLKPDPSAVSFFNAAVPGLGTLLELNSVTDILTQTQALSPTANAVAQHFLAHLDQHDTAKKIEEIIFPRVKKLLIEQIEQLVVNSDTRQALIEKVSTIHYDPDTSDCGEFLNSFTENAGYHPKTNSFQYCAGFLMTDRSEFSLVFTIGHELTHSIDPCALESLPDFKYAGRSIEEKDSEYPFRNVLGCLRSPESVHALRTLSGKSYCTKDGFDQVTESFPDWMGAQVLTEYMKRYQPSLTQAAFRIGYSNTFRDMSCAHHGAPDVHPETTDRINRILLSNPKVREQMGCERVSSPAIYCQAQ